MNSEAVFQPAAMPTFTPVASGLLQRCTATAECDECRKKREGTLQRAAVNSSSVPEAPPIVHETLRSPGRPLDSQTRAFMEPRFGRDFSDVRVHTDTKAAASAQAVNALAYTVGRDVVFAAGQYAPRTQVGSRLLAHELAHTIQNPGQTNLSPFLEIGKVDDPAERAADHAADAVMHGKKASLPSAVSTGLHRLRRACTANMADRPDRRTVRCDDGNEYRVKLTTIPERSQPETRASVDAGWNNNVIFLNVEVCRGSTGVQIRPTVDLPPAVAQVLGNVLAGSDALSGVTLSPGLQITVARRSRHLIFRFAPVQPTTHPARQGFLTSRSRKVALSDLWTAQGEAGHGWFSNVNGSHMFPRCRKCLSKP
jgi:uncharacterized protein DUF4157